MAHLGSGVEYGLHCLLWLADSGETRASSRDLADLQGISTSFVAKIFPKLEKARIVTASDGIRGGYRLARPASRITVLEVVDAIEGNKPLFECNEIRGRCALFDGKPPTWSTSGVCSIHAVMLRAEKCMRDELARTTLAELSAAVDRKAPAAFGEQVRGWISNRARARAESRSSSSADSSPRRR